MVQVVKVVPAAQAKAALARVGARLQKREPDGSSVFTSPSGAVVRVTPLAGGQVRFVVVKGKCNC